MQEAQLSQTNTIEEPTFVQECQEEEEDQLYVKHYHVISLKLIE